MFVILFANDYNLYRIIPVKNITKEDEKLSAIIVCERQSSFESLF